MVTSSLTTSLRVFGWLLWFDIRYMLKDFMNNLIDASAWPFFTIFVNGYVAPAMGMPADYGAFTTISLIVLMGAYRAWAGSMVIAVDLSGQQAILYELTLPLPYWMVWMKNGISLSLQAATFNLVPLLIGKLMLGSAFDLSHISIVRFALMYVVASLFFGMFALWSTVITHTAESHSRLELRLIGPMFFLNGWASSWAVMYAISPTLGIFVRCLPWIYAYEGCRAAVFGQAGYIDYWQCVLVTLAFTLFFALTSIVLFKRRMDCV